MNSVVAFSASGPWLRASAPIALSTTDAVSIRTGGCDPKIRFVDVINRFPAKLFGAQRKRGFGQANKGKWWMPWRQEAMKDVVSCEKPRGAAKQALIRGCPNGETRPGSCLVIVH